MTQSRHESGGFALVQLLVVLLILGVVSAGALAQLGYVHIGTKNDVRGGSTTACFANGSNAQCVHFGSSTACNADAKTLETAVAAYNALNNRPIGTEKEGSLAGDIVLGSPLTYSSATQASLLLNNEFLRVWPGGSSAGYSFNLSTTHPGDVMVHVPASNPGPGVDYYSQTGSNGCNDPVLGP